MFTEFHMLRPWWLIALVPAIAAWILFRSNRDGMRAWSSIIAPHLLAHLLKANGKRSSSLATHLFLITNGIGIVAAAGPTWHRAPTPFADDVAALAIVIKVTPSMLTEDVQPNRLTRCIEKIHDLLQLRGRAKTCLIAYSGTSHVVIPVTTDSDIIDTFARSLDPQIMPIEGDLPTEALQLAEQTIADSGGGSIWWLADDIPNSQKSALQHWVKSSKNRLNLYPAIAPGSEFDAIRDQARELGLPIVSMSADDNDIGQLARASSFRPAANNGEQGRWVESGYWLTPLVAVMLLPLFRRGTSVFGAGGDT